MEENKKRLQEQLQRQKEGYSMWVRKNKEDYSRRVEEDKENMKKLKERIQSQRENQKKLKNQRGQRQKEEYSNWVQQNKEDEKKSQKGLQRQRENKKNLQKGLQRSRENEKNLHEERQRKEENQKKLQDEERQKQEENQKKLQDEEREKQEENQKQLQDEERQKQEKNQKKLQDEERQKQEENHKNLQEERQRQEENEKKLQEGRQTQEAESELRSANESVTCTRSPNALNNVCIKDFLGWHGSYQKSTCDVVDERLAQDSSGGEGERNSVALPRDVVESLVSHTCDPAEFLQQMMRNLNLDKTCLKEPTPETARIIRCFVAKANISNRIDVVKHLRDIVPAGTSGPLLPGHLDIKNVPYEKLRELAINLCGGEDWKVVAERLGFTAAWILYFDNRKDDPFEAALMHYIKRNPMKVDDLYDILTECGMPVLADIL